MSMDDKVLYNVRSQVQAQVWDKFLIQVPLPVWDRVRSQVGNQVHDQVIIALLSASDTLNEHG